MKKGLILTNAFFTTPQTQHQIRRFQEEFSNLGVSLDVKSNIVLPTIIETGTIVLKIGTYDFILYLDKDKHIAYMLEKSGYRLFNPAAGIAVCDDKMQTYIALANHGIAMPKTIASPLLYPHLIDQGFIEQVDQALTYPIVVKECHGSLGKQVYKADNYAELCVLRNELKFKPHLYQELIRSSYGKDIRVMVIGGQVKAAMLRVSATDFRSNIANGGQGSVIALPDSYRLAAEKIVQLLQLDYAGIDFLIGPAQEPILCEVNSNAFFEEMERISGINVAGAYAKHIFDTIYGGEEHVR